MTRFILGAVLVSTLISCLIRLTEAKVELSGEDGTAGTISFGFDQNDELDHAEHMPDALKCDACRVISYLLTERFTVIHKKRPSMKMMSEVDIIDVVDSVCQDKFESYGVKEVNKVKRLSGPGLETDEVAGVLQAGGKWPYRIMEMCTLYAGEIGEVEIYEEFMEDRTGLEDFLCRGSGLQAYCTGGKDTREEL